MLFYFAVGILKILSLPFYRGAAGASRLPDGACLVQVHARLHSPDSVFLSLAYAEARLRPLHMLAGAGDSRRWPMRWMSPAHSLREALGWLKAGEAVGVCSDEEERAAALLALESGVPVVPAAVVSAGRRAEVRFGHAVHLLEKELRYAVLPRSERETLVKNLHYRITRSIQHPVKE